MKKNPYEEYTKVIEYLKEACMIMRQRSYLIKAEAAPKVFGVTLMTMKNPFFVALNTGLGAIIEEKGDEMVTLDPNLDQEKQNEQIKQFIDKKVDIIFVAPVDWKGIKPALEASKKAGIPIFNIDSPVYDEDLVTTIITSDNYNIGVIAGNDLMKRVEEANIVILDYPRSKSTVDRIQGFKDTVSGYPQYKIVIQESGEGQYDQAKAVMKEIIEKYPDFNTVIAVNDLSALGAIEALQEAGRIDKTLVYGVDGSPEAKRKIEEGIMTATVAQSPIELGMTSAEMGYVFLEGNPIKKNILIPVFLIDQENIYDYELVGWQ